MAIRGCIGAHLALILATCGCGTESVQQSSNNSDGVQGDSPVTKQLLKRFTDCATTDVVTLEKFSPVTYSVVDGPGGSAFPTIVNIDAFLEICPQNDPAISTILSDFEIRLDGQLITDIPCTEPISAMPLSAYSDALIVLQGLRVIYHMDRGRTGHLPWTAGTMYDWMKARIGGVNLRSSGGPSCCSGFDGRYFINVPLANDLNRDFDRRWEGISGNIGLYAHEVRHRDGFPHASCCAVQNGCDQEFVEANPPSYGLQWWLNRAWLTGYLDVGYACLDSNRVTGISSWHQASCNGFRNRLCDNTPEWVEMPPYPGTLNDTGPDCGAQCVVDSDCDDGLGCNGQELCVQGSCQQGVAVNCNDGVACTVDTCLESDGTCLHTPDESYCDDGRTCTSWTCDAIGGCQSETLPDCCGNGLCESGEDSITCPDDCASDAVPVCGNGVCEVGEDCTSQSCPQDCRGKQRGRGASRFCCSGTVGGGGGDGPVDCSDPRCSADGWICGDSPQTWCGDGVCDRQAGEDGCTCGEDCPSIEIETNCMDGEDEDCDGFVDCADSDCAGDPNCSASCGGRGTSCTTNDECCSGRCKRNGTCH